MLSVAIMGHRTRLAFIRELRAELPEAELVLDRHDDRWETGARALEAADPAATWHLVVQDDAILCPDLVAGVEAAARVAGEHPLGLYIGRLKPNGGPVAAALRLARSAGATWLAMDGPWWGVAIAVPTAHIRDLVAWGNANPIPNYDRRIARWYRRQGIQCWYTVPSLVDHRPVTENPSLIEGRTGDRRAHYFIGERSALSIRWDVTAFAPHSHHSRRRRGGTMTRRIAERRIYGYDRFGRRVLVAAPGQPIPADYEPDESTPRPKPTTGARANKPQAEDLSKLTRSVLDDRAKRRGIEAPERLPNKQAVIDALEG